MNYFRYISALTLVFIIISCGTEPNPPKLTGNWNKVDLENLEVLTLSYADNFLFIGTEEGAFKTNLANDIVWQGIGLKSDTTKVTKLIAFNSNQLIATVSYYTIRKEDKVIFKSNDAGDSWQGWPLELVHDSAENSYIYHLTNRSDESNIMYGYAGYILRSTNGAQSWERIFSAGVSEFLYVSKEHPNQIWTGGWNNIYSPYLAKSEDGGETWVNLNENINFATESSVFTAAIHPQKEEIVLVGLGGVVSTANVIRKSRNGGETWQTVLEGFYIKKLYNSPLNANTVYASGISMDGQLFVAISNNYGDNWKIEKFTEGPSSVTTNDMIVTIVDGKEVLYFGTTKGVYSYTIKE